jgi:hypothetical protein
MTQAAAPDRKEDGPRKGRLTRLLEAFGICATLLGVLSGAFYWGANQEKTRIDELQQQLNTRIEADNAHIQRLEGDLTNERQKASSPSNEIASLKQSLETAQSQLRLSQEAIRAGTQENAVLTAQISSLKQNLEATQSQLHSAQETIRKITQDNADLQQTVDQHRPTVDWFTDLDAAPEKIGIRVKNTSNSAIRLMNYQYSWMLTGVDADTWRLPDPNIVEPDNDFGIAMFDLNKEHAELVRKGAAKYHLAVCFIYQAVSDNDQRRWLHEIYFSYNYNDKHPISTWKEDDRAIGSKPIRCNLESGYPSDFRLGP